jgi:Protein of unknown function with HXXEE motif
MSHSSVRTAFGLLIAAQAVHSIEESLGRLWEVFPPAAFVSGLVSSNREAGFIGLNIALVAFGLWCFLWPVSRAWSSAPVFVSIWTVIEIVNGLGHPLWSFLQGHYTPGVATAPILLVLAINLAWQSLGGRPARGSAAS